MKWMSHSDTPHTDCLILDKFVCDTWVWLWKITVNISYSTFENCIEASSTARLNLWSIEQEVDSYMQTLLHIGRVLLLETIAMHEARGWMRPTTANTKFRKKYPSCNGHSCFYTMDVLLCEKAIQPCNIGDLFHMHALHGKFNICGIRWGLRIISHWSICKTLH